MSTSEGHTPGRADRYGFLLYAGILIGGAGAAGLFWLARRGPDAPDLQRYSAMGAVIAGVLFCYLSSLPRLEAIAWLRSGATALLVAFAFRWAVGEPYRIPSISMEPTLDGNPAAFHGDRVWVNKWWYGLKWPFTNTRIFRLHEPQRWEIVVFNAVEKDAKHPVLVKRVVGMPGERINIRDGKVFANGQPLELPPSMPPVHYTDGWQMKFGVETDDKFAVVPKDHYLVLGDNSGNSRDGRYFGWLPNENIVGRVASVWWPPRSWRDFTGFSQTWWWRGFVAMIIGGVFVRMFIGRSYPTYAPGGKGVDHYWVSFIALGLRVPFLGRFLVRWRTPQRGDLVLFNIAGDEIPAGSMAAARVAGLPGERIAISGAKVLVNNEALAANAWPGAVAYAAPTSANAVVKTKVNSANLGPGEYFLLSDDPADMDPFDSRILGPAPLSAISGKVTRRWWPLSRVQKI